MALVPQKLRERTGTFTEDQLDKQVTTTSINPGETANFPVLKRAKDSPSFELHNDKNGAVTTTSVGGQNSGAVTTTSVGGPDGRSNSTASGGVVTTTAQGQAGIGGDVKVTTVILALAVVGFLFSS